MSDNAGTAPPAEPHVEPSIHVTLDHATASGAPETSASSNGGTSGTSVRESEGASLAGEASPVQPPPSRDASHRTQHEEPIANALQDQQTQDQQQPPRQPQQSQQSQHEEPPAMSSFSAGLGAIMSAFMRGLRNAASPEASSASPPQAAPTDRHAPDGQSSAQHTQSSVSAPGDSHRNAPEAHASTSPPRDSPASNPQQGQPHPPLFFRLPFPAPDGRPALLAFTPGPLPSEMTSGTPGRSGEAPEQRQQQPREGEEPAAHQRRGESQAASTHSSQTASDPRPNQGSPSHHGAAPDASRSPGADGATPPRFHVPVAPIFVPLGASPLPFALIFDAVSSTAWPIVSVSGPEGPPGGMPSAEAQSGAQDPFEAARSTSNQPRLVAGPPFHILLDLNFGPPPPPPERPDPERASRFVASLERADAELRERMKVLEIGQIGSYGGEGDDEGGEVGCGICLESYDDRPAWLAGKKEASDAECVVVPCAGHHTLHAGCLQAYLATKTVGDWSCPFCRAPLCSVKVEESATPGQRHEQRQQRQRSAAGMPATQMRGGSPSSSDAPSAQEKLRIEATKRTLREEIRLRERRRGWRCDNPACLPRYPESAVPRDAKGESSLLGGSVAVTPDAQGADGDREAAGQGADESMLLELKPCHHELHLDCLLLSQRLEFPNSDGEEEDEEEDEDEDEDDEVDSGSGKGADGETAADADRNDDAVVGEKRRASSSLSDEAASVAAGGVAVVGRTTTAAEQRRGWSTRTVGRWVQCPCCRRESWAVLPARRRSKKRRGAAATDARGPTGTTTEV